MRNGLIYTFLFMIFAALSPIYLFQGSVDISWRDILSAEESIEKTVFYNIRMPRFILAIVSGAGLAVSGAIIQGIFRNPLVEPSLIGIASGSAVFASIAIVFFTQIVGILFFLQGFAFLGAVSVSALVYFMSVRNGQVSVLKLLLMGIGMNAICGSILGLLHFLASDSQLREITFWSLGSLGGANWFAVLSVMPFALLPVFSIPFFAGPLNALIIGDKEALHIGYSIEKFKMFALLIICLSVGAIVSITGIIGFIGLVVPHIIRLFGRANHNFLLPASALLGMILMVTSDWISRILIPPTEIPIGILTAGIGAPVFIWILSKKDQLTK
ncbi:FecCD family ABC transporter permease [Leptospira sp. GIMC2001]|uniref:FecCD family ABC transporter permease n=1 Tax=Leptospira sp. GIMC2001 TaxID=1513297 RepID=UPI00234AD612|nr:iron ABC transporter permease [Leptospira sp. GIMC2001]WCL49115.1 iron ABC transporter permease [Leptospira sp. GIMC2001]